MPRLDRLVPGFLAQKIILSFANTNYKRPTTFPARFIFIRAASVAAMQEPTWKPTQFVALASGNSDFRRTTARNLPREQSQNARPEPPL